MTKYILFNIEMKVPEAVVKGDRVLNRFVSGLEHDHETKANVIGLLSAMSTEAGSPVPTTVSTRTIEE